MTVKDEAAPTIGSAYNTSIPTYYVDPTIEGYYGNPRGPTIVASENYDVTTYAAQDGVPSDDVARALLTQLCTCSFVRQP